jgi:tetratricopeptide (TPR) repeat protein
MARSAAGTAADTADPVSNVVVSPKASLFVRQILLAALANLPTPTPDWVPEAQALLANVLMNDYLNWWNPNFPVDVSVAQNYANEAIATKPSPPDQVLALAYHALGLTERAQGNHAAALSDFVQAATLDRGFARAIAQVGNEYVLVGQVANSHGYFQDARKLAPNHQTCGYFDWGDGRACFQEAASAGNPNWSDAISLLQKSVSELPTVWYNQLYLACAQDAAGQTNAAQQTLNAFLGNKCFGKTMLDKLAALPPPNQTDPLFAARQRFYNWLQKVKVSP